MPVSIATPISRRGARSFPGIAFSVVMAALGKTRVAKIDESRFRSKFLRMGSIRERIDGVFGVW